MTKIKLSYLAALALGASMTMNAAGYKDGIEYYKAGQYNNAISLLTRNMNEPGTDKAIANYYLGQAYLSKGNKEKAREYFNAGIAADANCAYNYVGLGALDLLDNNKSAAESNFKKAQGLAKKNNEITVDIARAYFIADPVLYQKEIDKYIEKARKDSKNKEASIYILEGDREAKNRNFNQAATWYEQAITFDEDNPEGYVKYANTYYYVVPKYAIEKLEELLKKQPNSALAQRELAEKYYENGQMTKAAAQYGSYIQNPNHFPEDQARYAVLLFADNKYDEAINTANEVLKGKLDEADEMTMNRILLLSLKSLNRNDEALQAATKMFTSPKFASRLNVGDYEAYVQLLQGADKLDEAEQVLLKGRIQLPKEPMIALRLADVENKLGKSKETLDAYDAYITLTPEPTNSDYNTGANFAVAAVSAEKEDANLRNQYTQQGLKYLEKIIDPVNPNPNYLLRKVVLLLNNNLGEVNADVEAAIKTLLTALDANPENANPDNPQNSLNIYKSLYSSLASYYDKQGNKAAASDARAKLQTYSTPAN